MSATLVDLKHDHRKIKKNRRLGKPKLKKRKEYVKLERMGLVECFNSSIFVVCLLRARHCSSF